ncbi:hypothetical protein [Aquimarina algicola]|uniref:Uncharacterized protein n=1 Tax=Aquimarina algicola TaxID=2589995 RepID=A0A504IWL6_9FLAO|nr:hypothetical protein [Aquimarina algicola]TPN82877.1 hypothetical protein FHK87_20845 [Aquimarina algicola]
MSYDLDFWKYKKGIYLDNQEVYEKCSDAQTIDGLEDLPIESILRDVQKEFTSWKMNDSNIDFENPNGNGSFQIFTTKQFVRFDCYRMSGEDMNRIIDIMYEFGCPLYDPQVPQRYDQE